MFVKIRIWLCIYHCHLQLKTRAAQYRPRTTKPRGTTGNVVAPNSKNCKFGSAKLARPAKSSRSNPTGRVNDATLTMNSLGCDFHTSLSGRKPHWRCTPFHNIIFTRGCGFVDGKSFDLSHRRLGETVACRLFVKLMLQ